MNTVLLAAGILLLVKVLYGYNRGMVKELISLITLALMCVVVVILVALLHFVEASEAAGIIVAIILLLLLGIAHHFLRLLFFSAELVTKLPVISLGDKLLGMVVGAVETLFLVWMIYTFADAFDLGRIEEIIREGTRNSEILTKIEGWNPLPTLVNKALEYIPW